MGNTLVFDIFRTRMFPALIILSASFQITVDSPGKRKKDQKMREKAKKRSAFYSLGGVRKETELCFRPSPFFAP